MWAPSGSVGAPLRPPKRVIRTAGITAATPYLANGKSWGEKGPKRVVEEILDSLDRDSILKDARAEILARLKA